MATHTSVVALSTALALTSFPVINSASADDNRHGISIAKPATYADLSYTRPRGLFFTADDYLLDYNSYSYDDRYHGVSPSYEMQYSGQPIYYYYYYNYYAPFNLMYRYSSGGALYYWRRANTPR